MPRLRVKFVRPGQETNPLAEQIMEGFRSSTESLRRAVALVDELQAELARTRWELVAYFQSCTEPDAQIAGVGADASERDAPKGCVMAGAARQV